jgi:hypothetical protein
VVPKRLIKRRALVLWLTRFRRSRGPRDRTAPLTSSISAGSTIRASRSNKRCDWGWTVTLHPDDLKGLVDYWRSVLASGKPGEIEGRLRRYDGVYRWFLFRATPSLDNEGNILKWFGTNTNIEDRRRAELLLAGENLVLEMTAKGDSLESVLEALCRVVEQTASGCLCSVLVLDPTGSRVRQAVAPSLPPAGTPGIFSGIQPPRHIADVFSLAA